MAPKAAEPATKGARLLRRSERAATLRVVAKAKA